ncbi:RluA family pseudouridine synthase [soil metagenome]
MFAPLDPSLVLFEDHHLLVVNKPAPLLTQAPPMVPCLEAMAKSYLKDKYAKPGGVYLAVPHRLDRPVSGVVCFVRNTKAAQRVHRQFEDRTVAKTYWAIAEGEFTGEGEWVDWIRKLDDEARVEKGIEGEPGAKRAQLHYRVLQALPHQRTLVELSPLTGRMHQLRVQLAWRGHPVLGDELYGSTVPFGPEGERPRDKVIALHARKLLVNHPFSLERLTFVAPAPQYWAEVIDTIASEIVDAL